MKKTLTILLVIIAIKTQAQTTNFTYDNLGRLKTVNYSNGGSITYNYDANGNRTTEVCVAGILPVKWFLFNAKETNCNSILLQWQTTNEINNKGFSVEYSQDGGNYQTAGFVEANSNSNYSYKIPNLQQGNYYVRLKQIDQNGKFEYSTTQQVKINCNKSAISIYPNPTKDNIIVKGTNIKQIKIINQLGQVLVEQNNLNTNQQIVNVQHLGKGFYVVQIMDNNIIKTEKLIIE